MDRIKNKMIAARGLLVGALCALLASCGSGTDETPAGAASKIPDQSAPPAMQLTKAERLDALFSAAARDEGFMGYVAATRNGETLFAKGYGHADIAADLDHGTAVPFPVASVTKQWTSALTFLLAEDGVIDLNATANSVLGEACPFPQGGATIRHLMAHTSGLARDSQFYDRLDDPAMLYGPARPLARRVCALPQMDEPGTEFHYRNVDSIVLQAILEEKTGRSFASLLRSELLGPLGMNASGLVPPPSDQPDQMMAGYRYSDGDFAREDDTAGFYTTAAAGGLSTIEDMVTWNRAIINAPLFDGIRSAWLRGDGAMGYVGAGHWVFPYATEDGEWLTPFERRGQIGPIHNANIVRPQDGYTFTIVSNVAGIEMNNIYDQRGLAYETIRILLSNAPD